MTGGGGSQVQRMSKSDKEKQVKDLWKNYLSWERDIELRRDRDISSEKARMAGMGMESNSAMWKERLEAVNAELDKEKQKLKEGATIKTLRDYYAGESAKNFEAGLVAEAKNEVRGEVNIRSPEYRTGRGGRRIPDQRGRGDTGPDTYTPKKVNGRVSYGKYKANKEQDISNMARARMEEIKSNMSPEELDSSMMQFYENKFGTDLSADPEKLSEAEKSRKKAEEAAKGGHTSGKSLNAGSMSPKKKGKNPWI